MLPTRRWYSSSLCIGSAGNGDSPGIGAETLQYQTARMHDGRRLTSIITVLPDQQGGEEVADGVDKGIPAERRRQGGPVGLILGPLGGGEEG
jgi:hypothetical protein